MTLHEYNLWGRRATAARGEALPQSKLTADVVRDLRTNRRGLTAGQRVAMLGVHIRTVENVLARRTWGHV